MQRHTIFEKLTKSFSNNQNKDPTPYGGSNFGTLFDILGTNYTRPDRLQLNFTNAKTIVTPIYNRIAVDCASKIFKHVLIDKNNNDRYIKDVDSDINDCLLVSANKDQTGRQLIKDIVMSMLDEGVVAVVPTQWTDNSDKIDIKWDKSLTGFDIEAMRVCKITNWFPSSITCKVYNEETMQYVEMKVPKNRCAIIENPFYPVMNENGSVAQRLIRKMAILDIIDNKSASDKLDLLIKLPYAVKTELRKEIAEARRKDLEQQLSNSKLGIGYIDTQEEVQQLGRPIENQISKVVDNLTSMLFSQLSMPQEIMFGTASDQQLNFYMNSTIKPILNTIRDEFNRKFLSKTARSEGHTFKYYISIFDFVSITNLADIGDKLTRNAIVTSNELRSVIGLNPSDQEIADELSNKNMPIDMQLQNGGNYSQEELEYDEEGNPIEYDENGEPYYPQNEEQVEK